jgi:acetyltransferase-like isoleucine patch superfamily enzyme
MHLLARLLAIVFVKWEIFCTWIRSLYWKNLIEARAGKIGKKLMVQSGAFFSLDRTAQIEIGSNVIFAKGAAVFVGPGGKLKIGDGVFIGRGTVLVANHSLSIGIGTQIAHYVTIIDSDHRFQDKNQPLRELGEVSSSIEIGNEVWIGAQTVILRGKRIGNRSVIGAGAVVTKDIPEGQIAVGNPVRILLPKS